MSRNGEEGWQLYQDLYNKGIDLVFLSNPHCNTEKYKKAMTDQIKIAGSDSDGILKQCETFINNLLMEIAKKDVILAFEQAQKERDDLSRRTKEGMKASEALGKDGSISKARTGKRYETAKSAEVKAEIRRYSRDFNGEMTDAELLRLMGSKISKAQYYRIKKQMKEDEA